MYKHPQLGQLMERFQKLGWKVQYFREQEAMKEYIIARKGTQFQFHVKVSGWAQIQPQGDKAYSLDLIEELWEAIQLVKDFQSSIPTVFNPTYGIHDLEKYLKYVGEAKALHVPPKKKTGSALRAPADPAKAVEAVHRAGGSKTDALIAYIENSNASDLFSYAASVEKVHTDGPTA